MPRFKQIQIDVDVNRAIESKRQSFGETENEILRRILLKEARPAKAARPSGPDSTPIRARGQWSVEMKGKLESAANLKDAYRLFLTKLAELDERFLSAFSQETSRSRRFVARKASDLYIGSPHLAKDHARPLMDGWFYDTNLSTEQVAKRVRIAARLAGLRYGSEAKLTNNLALI